MSSATSAPGARHWDLLVFDWDGTLMDSTAAIILSLQAACRELGQPEPAREQAGFVIGLGLEDALRRVAPDLPPADYPRLVQSYRRHYFTRDHDITLFDGVAELLHDLRDAGHLLAVATGKSRPGLERALQATGLRGLFDATRTADETASKPHPQMLREVLEELGQDAERAVMIGDTTHDLLMARNAGVAALGVSYGAHDAGALRELQPLHVLESVPALRRVLLGD